MSKWWFTLFSQPFFLTPTHPLYLACPPLSQFKSPFLPSEAALHFIGPLQSNKVNGLVKNVPQLAVIESVSTIKLAKKISEAVKQTPARIDPTSGQVVKKLEIYVQIDTSLEASKAGIAFNDDAAIAEIVNCIVNECSDTIVLGGLMTIGAPGDMSAFVKLRDVRDQLLLKYEGKGIDSLELSMGMSGDYVEAIKEGATSVRVGSSIFGARDYSKSKA